ncbi:hypothetical protein OUZ56_010673 [Daphnia magna]|uniref:Uncharacterized protein n=1 Tax=Daphnia magna TaxID=35525 RepID=A0ABR0AJ79_9CRUS|nr:hypothetical protein OUZ56_010673 [Daphnia magna]
MIPLSNAATHIKNQKHLVCRGSNTRLPQYNWISYHCANLLLPLLLHPWDSIKTRISQPPDTGTPTLLQRPVDRPTLFLRLYPRDGADGVAISGVSTLIFHAVPLRLVSFCRGNNAAAPGRVPILWRKT